MSLERKIKNRGNRRRLRVRSGVKSDRLATVSVFRSLKHMYAQLVDISGAHTVVSSSSLKLSHEGNDKKAVAREVGIELAKRALEKGVEQACFNRGCYRYHGRVKALADGLREGGLKI